MMFKSLLATGAFITLSLLNGVMPAQAQTAEPMTVTCDNGAVITNGVEVTVSMRPGFTYTATAIGIGDFDPVLAVLGEDNTGLCEDDTVAARDYEAYLPTSDAVSASRLSAQVPFNHSNSGFSNITLVVGDYSGQAGEFILILEGMAVTAQDGTGIEAGDPFFINLTDNVMESGVPLNVYMISRDDQLDPMIRLVDSDSNDLLVCDDAGSTLCDTESWDLSDYWVSQLDGELSGYQYDAMMSIPLEDIVLDDTADSNHFEFRMTSYNQRTFGQYTVVFHLGTGEAASQQPQQ